MSNGAIIPRLAFGLYKVPPTEEGEQIISKAIAAGYRHFDTASLYGNEHILGCAIQKSGIPREDFFVCSKVWNDVQKEGRAAVRQSVENSLTELGGCYQYFDLFYIHWPVPTHFVETYKELQELYKEGKIRSIGLSNFGIQEYEELRQQEGITMIPTVNQMEVSPYMYRPAIISYFQKKNILVAASKALHRADGIHTGTVNEIAKAHMVTPAQIMLRWSFQKRLIVVAKTCNSQRMQENRSIFHFSLSDNELALLDSLTTEQDIKNREELELQRRKGL
jgi:diketogulonate reductase-like aldo/keto reductase